MVKEIAYGHDLKKVVKSFFGYTMTTYKEALQGMEHMGLLTGEQVVDYGCDDAIWTLKLFKFFREAMSDNLFITFLEQENPLISIYSDVHLNGLRANIPAVKKHLKIEQEKARVLIIKLKPLLQKALPFPEDIHEKLAKASKWYLNPEKEKTGWVKYRKQVVDFANKPNDGNELLQINGGVRNTVNTSKNGIINISHYMPLQTICYDLLRLKPKYNKDKKITADKDNRGKLLDEAEGVAKEIMVLLNEMSRIDQVCKLYLGPYLELHDPTTGKFYPSISNQLATRRMSMSNPNGQQLAKRGESKYVRGFYLADSDDEVLISADWSSIELVIPGEFSKDPYFLDCFGQLPYKDLHSIAAAEVMDLDINLFNNLAKLDDSVTEIQHLNGSVCELVTKDGIPLTPAAFKSYIRTEIGKGANFEYWFSGALSTTGQKMGWDSDEMWERTKKYRSKFSTAEEWRLETIAFAEKNGYVELPDFHRRYRFECTPLWQMQLNQIFDKYQQEGLSNFGSIAARKIQARARNQVVNAKVQGTAAALMKRTILKAKKDFSNYKWAKFKLPVHDELIYSVNKEAVLEFIPMLRKVMNEPKGLFEACVLNSTVSLGRTLEPFDKDKAPIGQLELDECPKNNWGLEVNSVLNEKETQTVLEGMY